MWVTSERSYRLTQTPFKSANKTSSIHCLINFFTPRNFASLKRFLKITFLFVHKSLSYVQYAYDFIELLFQHCGIFRNLHTCSLSNFCIISSRVFFPFCKSSCVLFKAVISAEACANISFSLRRILSSTADRMDARICSSDKDSEFCVDTVGV